MLPERIAGLDILTYERWQRDLAVYYWESWQLNGNQAVLLFTETDFGQAYKAILKAFGSSCAIL